MYVPHKARRSDRLDGRLVLAVWIDWVDLLFVGHHRLVIPPEWPLGRKLREVVPSFRFAKVAGRLLTHLSATWL